MKLLYLVIPTLLCLACSHSENFIKKDLYLSEEIIDSLAKSFQRDKSIPGMAVGVSINGEIEYAKGFGFNDTTNSHSSSKKSVFAIASITKFITAIGILKLQEEGHLSIDHPIRSYFPELPEKYSDFLIKNLLNHTSGLALLTDYADSIRAHQGKEIRNESILNLLSTKHKLFTSNEVWAYNNTPGFLLLSLLIERVSKMSYGDFLSQCITQPLDLKETGLCSEEPYKSAYRLNFNINSPVATFLDTTKIFEQLKGQGGVCSSVMDLLKIVNALDQGILLDEESLSAMRNQTQLSHGTIVPYGLGTRLGYTGTYDKMGHTGGAFTDFAALFYYPSLHLTIAVLTNAEPSNAPILAESIARALLNVHHPQKVPLDAVEYVGDYRWGNHQIQYSIDSKEQLWEVIDYGSGLDSLSYYFIGDHSFHNSIYGSTLKFQVEGQVATKIISYSSGLFSDSEIAHRK